MCGSVENVLRCSGCHATRYCSKQCQKSHHEYHSVYCNAISQLEEFEKQRRYGSYSVREVQVDFKKRLRIAKLIGDKPMLSCQLGGVSTEGLWDSGSQILMIDRFWLAENLPDEVANVMPVEEFLEGERLTVLAANKSSIPFDGVVMLRFSLGDGHDGFMVPVLVSSDRLNQPIIGSNVMKHLVKYGTAEDRDMLKSCLKGTDDADVEVLISMLVAESDEEPDFLADIKTPEAVKVPAGFRKQIRCRVKVQGNDDEQTVYFSPRLREGDDDLEVNEAVGKLKRGRTNYIDVEVINDSNIDRVLKKGEVIGSVHSVAAAIPMMKVGDVAPSKRQAQVNVVDVDVPDGKEDGQGPKFNLDHLTEEQKKMMEDMLKEVEDVFSRSDSDIGDIQDFNMEIHLTDQVPVKEAYRKIPRHMYTEVKNYIDDLISNGWVRQSCSSYSSPIVCVRKKDGGMRLCIDYRKLNAKTIPDAQPIPRIQDILDNLGGKRWFTTLDMSKAYHQGYIAERFRHMTAFSTPWTLLEWIRIPFGLKNCPPAFQRYINQVLGDLKGTICEVYLDDILVHSETFEQHVQDLKKVLLRLRSRGVKLRAIKCQFAKQEVRYLGRLISSNGYRPDPEETAALEKFREPPQTIGELRSLLGFLGYYRTYVKGFASLVKPMYDLLKGKISGGKDGKKAGQCYNSKEKVQWTDDLQKVLDQLLDYLKSPEVIAYPDYDLPFFLTTDASGYGLGSVLYQNQGGVDRIIGFASRTLSDSEKRYHFHSGKMEFLALKWAVTERFKDYLQGALPFVVYTDNNPLTYVLSSAKLNAVALRWVNDLADFNFSIKYRPGKSNADADYLSRRPMNIKELKRGCTETVDPRCMDAVLGGINHAFNEPHCCVSVSSLTFGGRSSASAIPKEEMIEEQKSDEIIGPAYAAVEEQKKPTRNTWNGLLYESKILLQNWRRLKIVNGVLMRETAQKLQVVLPKKYQSLVFTELHDKMAHLGSDRVIDLARQRFFWPKMARDIKTYVQRRCRCVADKNRAIPERAKMQSIETSYPFEVVAIDFIDLDPCKGGYQKVLVVTDLFTKFVQMYATKTKSSKAAATKLFNEFILLYGFPKRIMHDKGAEFNSGLFSELHRLTGIESSNTTPYHPMANGQCERMNRCLISMCKSLSGAEKRDWKSVLPKLSFAYNSTVHASTGFTPFFMMFGRESRLPIDEVFEEVQMEQEGRLRCQSHQQFVDEWKKSMQEVFKVAKEKNVKSQAYNKGKYDGKVREVGIEEGDRVLVKNLRERGGTGKLRSAWEHQIFEVVRQQGDLPVYHVRNLDKARDVRVLHRNHLMKCELPLDVFKDEMKKDKTKEPVKKPNETQKKRESKKEVEVVQEESNQVDSDEEGEYEMVIYPDDEEVQKIEVERYEVDGQNAVHDVDVPMVESTADDLESSDDLDASDDATEEPVVEDSVTDDQQIVDTEDGEDNESEEDAPIRRSTRLKTARKVFTFNKLGGAPSFKGAT